MSSMSGTTRASGEAALHRRIAERERIQLWLWQHARDGWVPIPQRWTHEDNEEAQKLGWMIIELPSKGADLFSLDGRPPSEIMSSITAMAHLIPVCAKALGILTAQKLAHPDEAFNFLSSKQSRRV